MKTRIESLISNLPSAECQTELGIKTGVRNILTEAGRMVLRKEERRHLLSSLLDGIEERFFA